MAIYTIGDLHLSFHENKPMSIFGDNWQSKKKNIKKGKKGLDRGGEGMVF